MESVQVAFHTWNCDLVVLVRRLMVTILNNT